MTNGASLLKHFMHFLSSKLLQATFTSSLNYLPIITHISEICCKDEFSIGALHTLVSVSHRKVMAWSILLRPSRGTLQLHKNVDSRLGPLQIILNTDTWDSLQMRTHTLIKGK